MLSKVARNIMARVGFSLTRSSARIAPNFAREQDGLNARGNICREINGPEGEQTTRRSGNYHACSCLSYCARLDEGRYWPKRPS